MMKVPDTLEAIAVAQQTIDQSIDALSAVGASVVSTLASLRAQVTTLQGQVAALQATGDPTGQLAAIQTRIDSITATLNAALSPPTPDQPTLQGGADSTGGGADTTQNGAGT